MLWKMLSIAVLMLAVFFAIFLYSTKVHAPTTAINIMSSKQEVIKTVLRTFPEAKNLPEPKISKPSIEPNPTKQIISTEQNTIVEAPVDDSQVTRIVDPYSFPAFSNETLNTMARSALVNIFCNVDNGQSVSGSGVIIDPRGIVMTNAHIGQFVLLAEATANVKCLIRTGAPAKPFGKVRVLFMPEAWVNEHAKDLRSPQPKGTGENDFALLLIEPLDNATINLPLQFIQYDTREAVSFEGDQVFLASYPAGFVGGFITQTNLHPATTITTIGELFTFKDSTIDLISLGGVIIAQGGSSGGAVLNQWGRLVGVIVTTSEGDTTADRDLRAITVSHIDRSLREHTGVSLEIFLDSNVQERANNFRKNTLPRLVDLLIKEIPNQ